MKILAFITSLLLLAPTALARPQETAQNPQTGEQNPGSDPSASPEAPAEAPVAPSEPSDAGPDDAVPEAAPDATPAGVDAVEAVAVPDSAAEAAVDAVPVPDPPADAAAAPEAAPNAVPAAEANADADADADGTDLEEAPAAPSGPFARSVPWDKPHRKLAATAGGAVDACEAAAFPLTFLPAIGSIAATLIEWVCLVPAALAIDYVGVHHAGYESFLWQPLVALLLAKLYRGVVLVVGISAIALTAALYIGVVSTALTLAGAAYYIPVGLTGVLTVIGGMIMAMRVVERRGSDIVFNATYTNLANELTDPIESADAQARAWVKPPPGPFGRTFALLSAAAGAEPEGQWSHAIPVAGPLFRAGAKAEAVEEATLQVGRDVLGENPQHPDELHLAAQLSSYTEGVFGAAGQALLAVGGLVFVAGTVMAALSYQANADPLEYALYIGGLGTLGVFVAGGGVVFILARQIPRVLRSFLVPAAFGFWPPTREEDAAE